MKDYLSVVYNEKIIPRTTYPTKLADYLCTRFNLKKNYRLLEIGCGRGDFLDGFKSFGLECSGVDISDYSVSQLASLDVKKIDISREKLPYEDNTFDVVFHKSLIEHLYSPENLMRETYRVLKPGGAVIILTPEWVSQMKVFYEDYTHNKPYDKNSLKDLLEIHNFTNIKSENFYQLPILWEYPILKIFSVFLRILLSTPAARRLSKITKIKFIRWSVELMVLASGYK